MKVAIVVFPGTSCGEETHALCVDQLKVEAEFVSETETNLANYDVIIIPGGASYGDAIRPGAIAAMQPVIGAVKEAANNGKPVLGIGNGFQILTEAGLLPGALLKNERLKFICTPCTLSVQNNENMWTENYERKENVSIPLAHGFGRYHCDSETLETLKSNQQILFTYTEDNPNGSVEAIAGISNQQGNVVGMMPHPERAVEAILGSIDGIKLFQTIKG